MKIEVYILTIAILSAILVPMSMGNNIAYSSSDNENENENGNENENENENGNENENENENGNENENENSENQKCYRSGFESGQRGSYNQTQLSECGNTGLQNAHAYYQGFIQGCIESGEGGYIACDSKTPGPP